VKVARDDKMPCESDDPKLSPRDADIIVKLSVFNRGKQQRGNYAISSEHIIVNGLAWPLYLWSLELRRPV
jgi:hypothetical protein